MDLPERQALWGALFIFPKAAANVTWHSVYARYSSESITLVLLVLITTLRGLHFSHFADEETKAQRA